MISIIIPTHNRLGPLLRAVDSVLNQSFREFELIVVDDGSQDATLEFLSRYDDSRLRVFSVPHGGVARARNFGVSQARHDWLCFLDSDDVWRRHKLSEQVRYHHRNPERVLSQTDDVWIRNSVRVNKMKKHQVREGDIFAPSLKLCLICCSSVMMKKSIFDAVGGFDESLETCEDYDLWLRLTCQYPVGFVAKPLVTKFGGHADQLSKKFPMMDRYRIFALEKLLQSGLLNEAQTEVTRAELEWKKTILRRGGVSPPVCGTNLRDGKPVPYTK